MLDDLLDDGHDYRSDFSWILEQGYDWVITDTLDLWAKTLEKQGRRNISYMLADGTKLTNETLEEGWYKRSGNTSRAS